MDTACRFRNLRTALARTEWRAGSTSHWRQSPLPPQQAVGQPDSQGWVIASPGQAASDPAAQDTTGTRGSLAHPTHHTSHHRVCPGSDGLVTTEPCKEIVTQEFPDFQTCVCSGAQAKGQCLQMRPVCAGGLPGHRGVKLHRMEQHRGHLWEPRTPPTSRVCMALVGQCSCC